MPVASTPIAVVRRREVVGREEVGFLDHDRPAAGREHRLGRPPASRRSRRRGCRARRSRGSVSHGHMNAGPVLGRVIQDRADVGTVHVERLRRPGCRGARGPRRRGRRPAGAAMRRLVWTVSRTGRSAMRPSARAFVSPAAHAEARAPPPTWIDEAVQGHVVAGEGLRDLEPERLAALDRQAVIGALAGERDGARVHGRMHAADGRIAGLARPERLTSSIRACRRSEALEDHRVGVGRDEDVQPAPGGVGHDRRRQGGVAAARDDQRAAFQASGPASRRRAAPA